MSEPISFATSDSRVETLRRFDILDTVPEQPFDDLAKLASLVVGSPIAAICFIDDDRNWVKASIGVIIDHLPTEFGACKELLAKPVGSTEVVTHRLKSRAGQQSLIPEISNAKSWIAAPIRCSGSDQLLGAVCLFDSADRKLTLIQTEALQSIARQVTRLLELKQINASLELATVKMQVLIDRDAVTGLPTERVFRGHLRTEFQYARRHGQPLSLVLVKVNSVSGRTESPEVFDEQVKKLARLLGRDTREYDLIARSGETEFAIVMRNATGEIGTKVATRLQIRIDSSDVDTGCVCLEFAVSTLTPDMVSSRDLITKAQDGFAKPRALNAA